MCQHIRMGRQTMMKSGTRPHPFGSLLLQPWGRWRKKQGWTEADEGTHSFSPGCGHTHCFSPSHPHLQGATPQGWVQRSPTTTVSAGSSLLHWDHIPVLITSSSAHQLILPPSTKPSASLQNRPWPLKGWQEQPSQEEGQGIKVSTHAREWLQER